MKSKRQLGIFNNVFFYIFLVFTLYMLLVSFSQFSASSKEVPISEVITNIREEKVQDIVVSDNDIEVLLKDGTKIVAKKESAISFDEVLKNNNLDASKIAGELRVEHRLSFEQILTPLIMFGFPILILFLIFRQMKTSSGDIFSFGRSRARVFSHGQSRITFNDVAGIEEAKREMMEIVDFLKYPQKYRKLGARIPKGVLLVGPSGVGKTLLAKAIAGEANVPFFSAAGSEFMEMLVGVGSSRVRDLFRMARESQPSLIFIDEVDAIGRQRGMGIGGGHDEREQTLNQILIEMDGFDTRTDVIVLAATNRPDMLDPALIRPGRFDRKITIPLPDIKEREEIIKIHMRGKPFTDDLKLERIAKKTVGFSGADIENMLNEAAILAARAGKEFISQTDVDEAALKVTLGSERKTLQSEEERKMTAYHEAGHALVSAYVKDMDPVFRVSIVARGGSLGHTSFPPERDRYNETKTRLMSVISTMLGGRSAEEIVFGELTVGAADDIDKATKIARRMVTEFGMSSLGPISFNGKEANPWVAREIGEAHSISDDVASKIDTEVEKIINECHSQALEILRVNRDKLDKISSLLLEKETIYEDEFKSIINPQE
ncbi:ATP-dependent metallopeptidase FtsH/Yme1/Tma family protein [candidate division WWE3 bacterium]|uniref:ATP-dependent zinc metalloprotease FtsH n=1 Tax=candidate division WWE3 bacterium TaxID=2053526 RepID=A0A3A4ZKE6_UNCKA|nr:MAG: ATP-dependent metallopeptidase FtsH/Yme1/Tma family protein [candidate division WWE3 bacterium]